MQGKPVMEKVGIVSCGVYVPRYRLKREVISEAWGGPPAKGEKAVANYDEDALTMAVEAGFDCLAGEDPGRAEGLFFASTSGPYAEKGHSSLVAAVLDLQEEILTADFGNSLSASTAALRAAFDAVRSQTADRILVTATEQRACEPGSELELNVGDGAGAVLVGRSDLAAELEGFHSISYEFTDLWRRQGDLYVRWGDPPFTFRYGYQKAVPQVIAELLRRCGLQPKEIHRLALYSPDPRGHVQVAKDLGFDPQLQVQDSMADKVGLLGTAHPLLLLAGALEACRPGDRILMVSYGGGAHAFLFRATDRVAELASRRFVSRQIGNKRELSSYNRYLQFRDFIRKEVSRPFTRSEEPFTSLAFLWKEQKQDIRFYGSCCKRCGLVQFPMRRVCLRCGSKDQMEDRKLSRRGKVYTFTKDYVFLTPDPPGVMVVVDLEGGGRFYGQMTDCPEQLVEIGMAVEMTYRKWHEASGIHHYFWKCRPLLGGRE